MFYSRRTLMAGTATAIASFAALSSRTWEALAQATQDINTFIKGPPVKDHPLKRVSPHIYMIEAPEGFPTPENQGMMANITFVIGRDGIVIIDTGASLQISEMAIRQLRAHTKQPVIGIINTHYHGDHWLGNHGFVEAYGKDLPIYALPETRKAIEGATGTLWQESLLKWTNQASLGTKIIPPNRDVAHGFTLNLGDVTLKGHHYGTAHTPADLCIEIVEDGVMCVGDVLMHKRVANMDEGSYQGSLDTISALIKNSQTKIWLPAHGEAGVEVLEWQHSLFQGIYETCLDAVKNGVSLADASALALKDPRVSSKAAETRGWDRNFGKYVSIAYLEAEQAQF